MMSLTSEYEFQLPYKSEEFIKIAHHFGRSKKIYPITYNPRFNKGTEVALKKGAKVYAVQSGIVISDCDSCTGGRGNIITIQHSDTTVIHYYHLSQLKVSAGDAITKGQVIGVAGSTGMATINGLGISIEVKGELVNPEKLMKLALEK